MIRLALAAAFILALGAAVLVSVDDPEGVVQGVGLVLALFAVLALVFALVELWRRTPDG